MNICIVSYKYPSKHSNSDYVFVKNLVDEFARQGHDCCVISPFNCLHYRGVESSRHQYVINNRTIRIFRPAYLSFTNKCFLKYISNRNYILAVSKAFSMMDRSGFKPDVIYCHFWSSGISGYSYAKFKNIPLFVASGESCISMNNTDGYLTDFCNYVKGVICVSSKNRDESVTRKLTLPEKCIVAPNAVNDTVFRKLDKVDCRKQLNLPQDKFIIAFVGWFIERKGPNRVAKAINIIESNDVYALFVGSGEQQPECKNILFEGKVPNVELPIYLNAADVFVLPTLHEGCCNAIVEAMSCGLPIISSNLPFNWDVLNERNSIMIDPNDIEEIKNAIVTLKNNDSLRQSMSDAALESAANLTIDKRARGILEFMQNKI